MFNAKWHGRKLLFLHFRYLKIQIETVSSNPPQMATYPTILWFFGLINHHRPRGSLAHADAPIERSSLPNFILLGENCHKIPILNTFWIFETSCTNRLIRRYVILSVINIWGWLMGVNILARCVVCDLDVHVNHHDDSTTWIRMPCQQQYECNKAQGP